MDCGEAKRLISEWAYQPTGPADPDGAEEVQVAILRHLSCLFEIRDAARLLSALDGTTELERLLQSAGISPGRIPADWSMPTLEQILTTAGVTAA